MKRGVYGWNMEGLPFKGEYDPKGAGRTPSVVEEEIFAYGRKVICDFLWVMHSHAPRMPCPAW